jgi:ATP-dependent Lon protease
VFDSLDLHLHFPSGSTPKDGPSAGIAIATAIMSLLTERASRHDVAMSGEVSLLGAVLPVGGLREKLLAAIRAGIPEVVVPARNAQDILRLAPDIKSRIRIHLIDDVREAFQIALVARPAGPSARRRAPHGPRKSSGDMGA